MIQTHQERVLYILKEIANMELIIAGKTKVDLENDLTLEPAVSMTLQLISEKISKISDEFQENIAKLSGIVSKGFGTGSRTIMIALISK